MDNILMNKLSITETLGCRRKVLAINQYVIYHGYSLV